MKLLDEIESYTYIIAGAGCSGLSLMMHLQAADLLENKRVLLIDQEQKTKNDRTWCFWENELSFSNSWYASLQAHSWPACRLKGDGKNLFLQFAPYAYRMIRSADFYEYVFRKIGPLSNVNVLYAHVDQVSSAESHAEVRAGGKLYRCEYLFSSIKDVPAVQKGRNYLLQHFMGWWIKTEKQVFNPDEATLMDFHSGEQTTRDAFTYVLPINTQQALIEYTVFSASLLEKEAYRNAIEYYLKETLGLKDYQVEEEEFGVIPMTDHAFLPFQGRIVYLGTSGGMTKGSTGYTFRFIQKHCEALVDALLKTGKPFLKTPFWERRFGWYDHVLLEILSKRKATAEAIFIRLFSRNKTRQVLKFLDNESTWRDEFSLLFSLQKRLFLDTVIRSFFKKK